MFSAFSIATSLLSSSSDSPPEGPTPIGDAAPIVVPGAIAFPALGLCTRLLAKYFPRTTEEALSRPV